MAEYIEREAVIRLREEFWKDHCDHMAVRVTNIKNIPAADVVKVRHGEWVKDTRTADVCAEYRCSLCGFVYCEADPKYAPYKYCPECGSKNE